MRTIIAFVFLSVPAMPQVCGGVTGVIDWNGGGHATDGMSFGDATNGAGALSASVFGIAGTWTVRNPTNLTFSAGARNPFATAINCPGVYTTDASSSSFGARFATNSTLAAGAEFVTVGTYEQAQAAVCINSTIAAGSGANDDVFTLWGDVAGARGRDFLNWIIADDGAVYTRIEAGSGVYTDVAGNSIGLQKYRPTGGPYYWLVELYRTDVNGPSALMEVRLYNGGLSGCTSNRSDNPLYVWYAKPVVGGAALNRIFVYDGKNSVATAGARVDFGPIKISNDASMVLTPSVQPAASLASLAPWAYIGNSATLNTTCTWASSASVNGGVGTVNSTTDSKSYAPSLGVNALTLTCSAGSLSDQSSLNVSGVPIPSAVGFR